MEAALNAAETRTMLNMTDAMIYAMETPGALAVAFVESKTGRAVAGFGNEVVDFDTVTPGWTDILRMQMSLLDIEADPTPLQDLVITTDSRYHVLRPLNGGYTAGMYLYLALDNVNGSIPLASYRLKQIERDLVI